MLTRREHEVPLRGQHAGRPHRPGRLVRPLEVSVGC